MKDWDKILREIPTPPDSDAEDDLNIEKVKKNARNISDILHQTIPSLDPSLSDSLPRGVNDLSRFASHWGDAVAPAKGTCASPPAPGGAASSPPFPRPEASVGGLGGEDGGTEEGDSEGY